MSLYGNVKPITLRSAATLTSNQYMVVKRSAEDTVIAGTTNCVAAGILQNAPANGALAEVAHTPGDNTWAVVVDASVAVGANLKSDGTGKLTAATTDKDFIVARALETVTGANQITSVELVMGYFPG